MPQPKELVENDCESTLSTTPLPGCGPLKEALIRICVCVRGSASACLSLCACAREGGIPCCDTKAYAFLRSKNAKTARAGEAEGHKGSEKEEKGEERMGGGEGRGGLGTKNIGVGVYWCLAKGNTTET